MSEKSCGPAARAVLQQCLQARLQVKPAEGDSEAQWVQVRDALCVQHLCRICRVIFMWSYIKILSTSYVDQKEIDTISIKQQKLGITVKHYVRQ